MIFFLPSGPIFLEKQQQRISDKSIRCIKGTGPSRTDLTLSSVHAASTKQQAQKRVLLK